MSQIFTFPTCTISLLRSPSISIKLYLTAANVSTLLVLFGDKSEENAKRIKYCKWKAVTIAKEAKAGAGPPAGTSGNVADTSGESGQGSGGFNEPPPPPADNSNFYDDPYAPSSTNYSSAPVEPEPPASPKKEEPEVDFCKGSSP